MFIVDRSFQFWKESKVSALGQKVSRSLKHSEHFPETASLNKVLENKILDLEKAKKQIFIPAHAQKELIRKANEAIIACLLELALKVEAKAVYKSDVVLSGFHPGRVQRTPRYIRQKTDRKKGGDMTSDLDKAKMLVEKLGQNKDN